MADLLPDVAGRHERTTHLAAGFGLELTVGGAVAIFLGLGMTHEAAADLAVQWWQGEERLIDLPVLGPANLALTAGTIYHAAFPGDRRVLEDGVFRKIPHRPLFRRGFAGRVPIAPGFAADLRADLSMSAAGPSARPAPKKARRKKPVRRLRIKRSRP